MIAIRARADWWAAQAPDEVSAAGEATEGSEHAAGELRGPSQRGEPRCPNASKGGRCTSIYLYRVVWYV